MLTDKPEAHKSPISYALKLATIDENRRHMFALKAAEKLSTIEFYFLDIFLFNSLIILSLLL